MSFQFFTLIPVLLAPLFLPSNVVRLDSAREPETAYTFQYSLMDGGNPVNTLSGVLRMDESLNLRDKFVTPYLNMWQLPASGFGGKLKIEPSFVFEGDLDPDRRICTDLHLLDQDGNTIHHDWQLCGDARIGAKKYADLGPYQFIPSEVCSSSFYVPLQLLPRIQHVVIRFRELNGEQIRHFPIRPHKCDPRVTEPDADGTVTISFTNPAGLGQIEDDCLVAFECLVYDADGELVRSDFRVVKPRADGKRYQFKIKVEAKHYDFSYAGIGFFHRGHGRNEAWLFKNLSATWGVGHSGRADGGKLVNLPLEGKTYFDGPPSLKQP